MKHAIVDIMSFHRGTVTEFFMGCVRYMGKGSIVD